LDSGTTLFYAPRNVISKMTGNLKAFCEKKNSKNCGGNERSNDCFHRNEKTYPDKQKFFDTFPQFHFELDDNVNYSWDAANYLYQENLFEERYCISMLPFNDRTILGGVFMKNHDILFDKKNSRIGIVKANCGGFNEESKAYYQEFTPIDLRGYVQSENGTSNTSEKNPENVTNTDVNSDDEAKNSTSLSQTINLPRASITENIIGGTVVLFIFVVLYFIIRILRERSSTQDGRMRVPASTPSNEIEVKTISNMIPKNGQSSPIPKFSITDGEEGFHKLEENYDDIESNDHYHNKAVSNTELKGGLHSDRNDNDASYAAQSTDKNWVCWIVREFLSFSHSAYCTMYDNF